MDPAAMYQMYQQVCLLLRVDWDKGFIFVSQVS